MKQTLVTTAVFAVLVAAAGEGRAEINAARASYNYQMFCQGCHTPDGSGFRGVPQLKGSIGTFLKSQQGREYLVRVPGAANSPLDDAQLAELMNWNIEQFAGNSVPANWRYYSADEVAEYREQPLLEVMQYRSKLLKIITAQSE